MQLFQVSIVLKMKTHNMIFYCYLCTKHFLLYSVSDLRRLNDLREAFEPSKRVIKDVHICVLLCLREGTPQFTNSSSEQMIQTRWQDSQHGQKTLPPLPIQFNLNETVLVILVVVIFRKSRGKIATNKLRRHPAVRVSQVSRA